MSFSFKRLLAPAVVGLFMLASPVQAAGNGDFNGDGKVNILDATMALRASIGLIKPTEEQLSRADLNGDGKVNTLDAVATLRAIVNGKPPTPPPATTDGDRLPAPAPLPPGPPDEAAALLAKQIVSDSPDRLAALLTALREAGIGVRDTETGRIVVMPKAPKQGLVFQAWEVLAMYELATEFGGQVSLSDLSATLAFSELGLDEKTLEQNILAGLQTHAEGDHPTLRFWARLIVEIGKASQPSHDLLGGANPQSASLNSVQVSLLLLRLTGDLLAFSRTGPEGAGPQSHSTGFDLLQSQVPCKMGDLEGTILDATGLGAGYGFGKLMEYLESSGIGAAGKYGKAAGAAAAALTVLKYLATQAAFEAEMELEGGPTLQRTNTTKAGEQRHLKATLKMDIGKAQWVNCFRFLLMASGMDFNLPNDGAVEGAEVSWTLASGGVSVGQGRYRPVVRFYGGDPTRTVTDAQGVARMGLEGAPQQMELPDWLPPIERTVHVRISVALQRANMVKDLLAAVGTATSGPFMPITFTTEMLMRLPIPKRTLPIIVKDWGIPTEVYVKSHRKLITPGGGNQVDEFEALIPVEVNDDITAFEGGDSFLRWYTRYNITDDCSITLNDVGSLKVNLPIETITQGSDMTLRVQGELTGDHRMNCTDPDDNDIFPTGLKWPEYMLDHVMDGLDTWDTSQPGAVALLMKEWAFFPDEKVFRKTYPKQRERNGFTTLEDTTWEIRLGAVD